MVVTERHILTLPTDYAEAVPGETVFDFQATVPEASAQVLVWLVVLDKTCLLWLGEGAAGAEPSLDSLIVAMHSAAMGSVASTLLARGFADAWDDAGEGLAGRLAKRYGVQVFLSDQLSPSLHQSPACHFIEKAVRALLDKHFPV